MDLTCPKCQAMMRTYERNGVHVDQCSECRGIFLDRGELERLVDAEDAWHGGSSTREPSATQAHDRPSSSQPASGSLGAIVGEVMSQARAAKQGSSSSHSGSGSHGQPHRKKSSSFLGELFG